MKFRGVRVDVVNGETEVVISFNDDTHHAALFDTDDDKKSVAAELRRLADAVENWEQDV